MIGQALEALGACAFFVIVALAIRVLVLAIFLRSGA